MPKVRFRLFLEERQKETLEGLQREIGVPVAGLIRKAVEDFIRNLNQKRKPKAKEAMTEKLLATAGIYKNGPRDLAGKHDFCLYGAKK